MHGLSDSWKTDHAENAPAVLTATQEIQTDYTCSRTTALSFKYESDMLVRYKPTSDRQHSHRKQFAFFCLSGTETHSVKFQGQLFKSKTNYKPILYRTLSLQILSVTLCAKRINLQSPCYCLCWLGHFNGNQSSIPAWIWELIHILRIISIHCWCLWCLHLFILISWHLCLY